MKKNIDYKFRWRLLNSSNTQVFLNLLSTGINVVNLPTGILPSGHQKMNGLQSGLWSGYRDSYRVEGGFTGIGELVLIRKEDQISKAYCYPLGRSGDSVRIGPQFRHFDGHHSPICTPAPIGSLFGRIPWPLNPINDFTASIKLGDVAKSGACH